MNNEKIVRNKVTIIAMSHLKTLRLRKNENIFPLFITLSNAVTFHSWSLSIALHLNVSLSLSHFLFAARCDKSNYIKSSPPLCACIYTCVHVSRHYIVCCIYALGSILTYMERAEASWCEIYLWHHAISWELRECTSLASRKCRKRGTCLIN
jgi:hypothetical protein